MFRVSDDGPPLSRDAQIALELVRRYGSGRSLIAGYNASLEKCIKLLNEQKHTFSSLEKDGVVRTWTVEFQDAKFVKSSDLMPIHCVEQGRTYGIELVATAHVKAGDAVLTGPVNFGSFPIMLGSDVDALHDSAEKKLQYGEDPDDPGMYFIIEGKRYAFIRSEGVRVNTVVCYTEDKGEKNVREGKEEGESDKKTKKAAKKGKQAKKAPAKTQAAILISAITTQARNGKTSLITMYAGSDSIIRFSSFRGFAKREKNATNLNVLNIFRVFGYTTSIPQSEAADSPIVSIEDFVLGFTKPEWRDRVRMALAPSLEDYLKTTEDQLLQRLRVVAEHKSKQPLEVHRPAISENLYSHLEKKDFRGKLALLAHQMVRLIEVRLGLKKMDDRNDFSVKQFKNVGISTFQLFAVFLEKKMEKIKAQYNPYLQTTSVDPLRDIFAEDDMTVNFAFSFKKNWQLKDARNMKKKNYTEALKLDQFILLWFHVNKIVRSRDPHTTSYFIRGVRGDQVGIEDPGETPESEKAGLNNTGALLEYDSRPGDDKLLLDRLATAKDTKKRLLVKIRDYHTEGSYDTILVVNGIIIGVCQGAKTYRFLWENRRDRKAVPEDACLFYDVVGGYLHVNTEAGRPTQLLYVVNPETHRLIVDEKDVKDVEDVETLLAKGAIAFVDSKEKAFSYVAQGRKYMEELARDIKDLKTKISNLENIRDNWNKEKGANHKYVRAPFDSDQIITKEASDQEIAGKKQELTIKTAELQEEYEKLVDELKTVIEASLKVERDYGVTEKTENFYDKYRTLIGQIERLRLNINFYDPNQYDFHPTRATSPGVSALTQPFVSLTDVNLAIDRLAAQLHRLQKRLAFDYCEIDESMIYGITSSTLLYIHKIPGPRQVFGAKMAKQAEGNNNMSSRWRTVPTKTLVFPARPICKPQIEPVIGLNRHPNGFPVILAMVSHEGWSIEDALVFSRGFLERNGFLSTTTTTLTEPYEKTGDKKLSDDSIVSTEYGNDIPQSIRALHPPGTFDKLDERGIVKPGSVVNIGDCVIGSYKIIRNGKDTKYKDASTYIKVSKVGTVTKVLVNNIGKPTVTIEIQQMRVPEEGDKFSSFQAQKGVIGRIENDEDLPYAIPEEGQLESPMAGIIPDVFMNPPAQPSRMTVGMLRDEALKSKAALFSGKTPDATAFRDEDIKETEDELRKVGLHFDGEERMIHGKTGLLLRVRIYIGVVQYLRLLHEAVDKVQNRYTGSYLPKTRQPITGRDNAGGQRYGEMEIEAIITYGASYTTTEYLSRMSDYFNLFTCARCNTEAERRKGGVYICPGCGEPAELLFAPTTFVEKNRSLYVAGAGIKTTYVLEPVK